MKFIQSKFSHMALQYCSVGREAAHGQYQWILSLMPKTHTHLNSSDDAILHKNARCRHFQIENETFCAFEKKWDKNGILAQFQSQKEDLSIREVLHFKVERLCFCVYFYLFKICDLCMLSCACACRSLQGMISCQYYRATTKILSYVFYYLLHMFIGVEDLLFLVQKSSFPHSSPSLFVLKGPRLLTVCRIPPSCHNPHEIGLG